MAAERILLGVVGRPHGVRGLVHVHSYTADPADLCAYGPLLDDDGRAWTVAWRGNGVAELRDAAGRPLPDRTAAERLVNLRLSIERDRLPAPDEDEFYLADLVGTAAVTPDGAALGRVTVVHDYGAGASLEITGEGPPLLVPFTRACVPDIDLAAGRVTVVLPDEVVVATDRAAPLEEPSPAGRRGQGEGGPTAANDLLDVQHPSGERHPHPAPLPPAGEGDRASGPIALLGTRSRADGAHPKAPAS